VVEKGKARIFTVTREDIQEVGDIYTHVPGRHVRGGWAQARLQRHHNEHVQRHLKATSEQLFALFQDQGFDHLFLSGPHDLLMHLRELLHPYVRARYAGEMSLPIAAPAKEVADATIAALDHLAAEKEAATLQRLLDAAGADGLGVTGLAATLDAVQRGQVALLVMADGVRCTGWYVPELHYYTARSDDPLLASTVAQPADDLAGALMDCAFEQGAEVLIVGTPAARAALAPFDGVGALLRFRLEPAAAPAAT
jgi:peptide subunit release factor 1 (eRF1)